MASKGLNKDAEGFSKLTSEDIGNIEKGHASIYYSGILARVYGLQYQLNNDLNPNGHSLLERLEYWRHGMLIIKSPSFFAGVGVGDVQSEFNRVYQEHNTQLEEANWHRAHNMFLTTLIGIGIIGLFIFIWLHSELILQMIRSKNTLALLFMIITLVSYMTEDTLETQTGVTFFSLFFALFISRVVKASKN
jgi:O-antigen ligase